MFSEHQMRRGLLRAVARTLIGAVLLSQLAVSVHACPGRPAVPLQTAAQAVAQTAAGEAGGGADTPAGTPAGTPADTPAAEVGVATPHAHCAALAGATDLGTGTGTSTATLADASLCAGHCQPGQQSDQAATVTVTGVALATWYLLPPLSDASAAAAAGVASAAVAGGLRTAAPPPHSILHCCFRI
jgi:hypothetical protein